MQQVDNFELDLSGHVNSPSSSTFWILLLDRQEHDWFKQ